MTARLTFLGIIAFWVTMNILLWRTEYGSHGEDVTVPQELVWRRILTAPDASSLGVFQNGGHIGFCELSTGVGQAMAALDSDKLPQAGLAARAGYQIRLSGNVSVGDFTNRLRFEGHLLFNSARQWQELNLKISSRVAVVEIHSLATNQVVHVKVTSDGEAMEHDLAFADLQNPGALLRAFTGNFGDALLGAVDLPELASDDDAQKIQWDARRTRVKLGSENVPVYRLQTSVLGRDCIVDVSTLGEILHVELPGGISARIEEWGAP